MSFPKYEVYKDSGVEWLGEVPEHWSIDPLKYHAQVFPSNVDKKTYEGQAQIHLCNYTDVYYNDEIIEGMDFMPATATEEQINKFRLQAGDVIFTKDSETANDIAIAAYVPRDLPGVICGYHLSMVRSNTTVDGAFIKRFFDSRSAKAYFEVSANGLTRVGLGQYATDNIPTPVPPFNEQTQIARFLDHETARIDALIAEQQRLIELLKEKRQAVISHAVTKGLDPTAPMKDSGVEWLGEVPAHWRLHLLKRAFESVDYGISSSLDSEGNIAILRMGNIGNGIVIKDDLKYIDTVPNELFLRSGDLLYNRTNSLDQIGKVGIFYDDSNELQFSFASYLVRLRVNGESVPEYFAYLLNTQFILNLARASAFVAIGQCNLNPARYGYIAVAVPPRSEQVKIIEYLDRNVSAIDKLIVQANVGIQLLQERRSALISAAVTGKIDVRGWQAPASAAPAATLEAACG